MGTYGDESPSTLTDVEATDLGPGDTGRGDAGRGDAGRGDAGRRDLGRRRRRPPRVVIAVLGVAILVAAGVAGGHTLLHHRAAQQAQASPAPSRGVAATTSAASPSHPSAARPHGRPPRPYDHQAARIGNPTIAGVSCPEPAMCYAVNSVGAISPPPRRPVADRGHQPAVRARRPLLRLRDVLPRYGQRGRRHHTRPGQLEQPGLC